MKYYTTKYEELISVENLLDAWKEFRKDKSKKNDVQHFEFNLMSNVLSLHSDLENKTYKHGSYEAFKINDPKPRDIHKAAIRDRVLHHAMYRKLYPFYDKTFIADSHSCRVNKGTHKAIKRFEVFTRKVSKNYTKQCWILKCDIQKFFASIDHEVLKDILRRKILDMDILNLLYNIIDSFSIVKHDVKIKSDVIDQKKVGLPLGNLTSQLLVNIYMNEFDQYVKHVLKVKYYIRYADDFVFMSQNRIYLENIQKEIEIFLRDELKLNLHPDKVFIKTIYGGVDFLGWVHFSTHRVLRTSTKNRMLRNINENNLSSYLGMLAWGSGHKLKLVAEKAVAEV